MAERDSEDLLEQLGLHPAQLEAQHRLLSLHSALKSGTSHPLDEAVNDPSLSKVPPSQPPLSAAAAPSAPLISTEVKEQPKAAPVTMPSPMKPSSPVTSGTPSTGDLVKPPNHIMTNAQNQVESGQKELDRLRKTGSGISQIKNPFLKTLARIGDIAGTATFPGLVAAIPGTELHHDVLENQATRQIEHGLKSRKEETEVEKGQSEIEEGAKEDWKELAGFTGSNGEPLEINSKTGEVKIAGKMIPGIKIKPKEPVEGELPLGDKVPQLNQLLESRYQVLNPGQPLPPQYKVPDKATQKDYDRIDKSLESEERAKGTKAQQDTVNELRRQTQELAREARHQSQDKLEESMVIGTDRTGRQVAMSEGEAKKQGLTNIIKTGAPQAEKITNARNLLYLFNNKSKEDPGLIQLAIEMEKQGQLGVIASRWNEFMAGTIGAEEVPGVERLRTLMGLATTALMQVHVGNRGGAYLLEHFEDLVNNKKMNAQTLLEGLRTEYGYIKHRAMLPGTEGEGTKEVQERKVSKAEVEKQAKAAGMSYEDAKADAESNGIKVIE